MAGLTSSKGSKAACASSLSSAGVGVVALASEGSRRWAPHSGTSPFFRHSDRQVGDLAALTGNVLISIDTSGKSTAQSIVSERSDRRSHPGQAVSIGRSRDLGGGEGHLWLLVLRSDLGKENNILFLGK